MRHRIRRHRQGFTLIEILIVVAIILVLTAIGAGLARDLIPRWRTRKAAMQFEEEVQNCRMLAVRSGRECRVLLVDYDPYLTSLSTENRGEYWVALGDDSYGSTAWDILPVDTYTDSTDNDSSMGMIDIGPSGRHYVRYVSIAKWDSLAGPGSGNSNAIVFSPRGFVENPSSDFNSNGFIEVKFVNKVARREGISDDFIVSIARGGMVRVDSTRGDTYSDSLSAGTAKNSSESN